MKFEKKKYLWQFTDVGAYFFNAFLFFQAADGKSKAPPCPPASLEWKTIENTVGLLEVGDMDEREIKQTEMLCKVICKCNKNICNLKLCYITVHIAPGSPADRQRTLPL